MVTLVFQLAQLVCGVGIMISLARTALLLVLHVWIQEPQALALLVNFLFIWIQQQIVVWSPVPVLSGLKPLIEAVRVAIVHAIHAQLQGPSLTA